MFQNDTITFMTQVETNTLGSISTTLTPGTSILVDAQYISKEKVNKTYGLTDANEWIQIFDLTLSTIWTEGEVIKYGDVYYKIRKVIGNQAKISLSNHVYVVCSRELDVNIGDIPWILADGVWNDNGIWDDTDVWID